MVVTEVLQQLAHSLQQVRTALVLVTAVTDLNMQDSRGLHDSCTGALYKAWQQAAEAGNGLGGLLQVVRDTRESKKASQALGPLLCCHRPIENHHAKHHWPERVTKMVTCKPAQPG